MRIWQKKGDYLGFTINSQGTKPLATRVEAVNNMSKPKDINGVRHFLGVINFYRRFTPTPPAYRHHYTNI